MVEFVSVEDHEKRIGLEGGEAAVRGLLFAERQGADLTDAYVIVEDGRCRGIGGWSVDYEPRMEMRYV